MLQIVKAGAGATVCQNFCIVLTQNACAWGSAPYSETVGLQVLLLGLAHGGATSAAPSTEPSSGPFSKAAMTRPWMRHKLLAVRVGAGVMWGLARLSPVFLGGKPADELDLPHTDKGEGQQRSGSLSIYMYNICKCSEL